MVLEFEKEEFDEWVKQGLKISHGLNLDPIPDDELPNFVPTAPVAFAMVTDKDAIDADFINNGDTLSFPMMIPLPMKKMSLKAITLPHSYAFTVQFKSTWTLPFIKPSRFCDFFLALPIPGTLTKCCFHIPNSSDPDLEPDSICEPMFGDVHFFERIKVEGGAEVFTDVMYASTFLSFDYSGGPFSFHIPLHFPFYSNGFRGDQKETATRRCKIRLCLYARENEVLGHYSVNYPLKVLIKEESIVTLLQELEGRHVQWPDEHLDCTYTSTAKEGTKHDRPTYEIEEPARKKLKANILKAAC